MRCFNFITLVSCFILFLLVIVNSELYTAVVDLQEVLRTEGKIVKALKKYLESEEQRLEKVRWLLMEYNKLYKTARKDVETFIFNPINAYLMVKRLTVDWRTVQVLSENQASTTFLRNISYQNLKFPDYEDLNGAAIGLMRLQDTYLLGAAALARGHIEGTAPSPELSSGDCFELGRQAFNSQLYHHTISWMQEALNRIENESVKLTEKAEILEYMAYASYMSGNSRDAVKHTKHLLQIDPEHPRGHMNLQFYSDVLGGKYQFSEGNTCDIASEFQNTLRYRDPEGPISAKAYEIYERLCRGENIKTPAEERKLKCHYTTKNHPFLILQPAKEEELHLKPRLVVYHDAISDTEIEIIKYLAKPKLARAAGVNEKSGESTNGTFRISKSAWLRDDDHEVLRRISQRVEAITGLVTDTGEDLQVVNYGIGGHYYPHFDFFHLEIGATEKVVTGTGNRIATWINYMSDVDAGGATVFPAIGVRVKPIKGSAAFWYNLFQNGEGDLNSLHAACPVLSGSKWVSNKWLHELGQEFRRLCSLNPEE